MTPRLLAVSLWLAAAPASAAMPVPNLLLQLGSPESTDVPAIGEIGMIVPVQYMPGGPAPVVSGRAAGQAAWERMLARVQAEPTKTMTSPVNGSRYTVSMLHLPRAVEGQRCRTGTQPANAVFVAREASSGAFSDVHKPARPDLYAVRIAILCMSPVRVYDVFNVDLSSAGEILKAQPFSLRVPDLNEPPGVPNEPAALRRMLESAIAAFGEAPR